MDDFPPRDDTFAAHGLVATCSPLASAAGLSMLHAGGNAVDATVTAAAVLTVVEPLTGTMGGDAFVQLWDPGQATVWALNASGEAPEAATAEAYRKRGGIPDDGMLASTVPGVVDGWATLLQRYGTRALAECLAPARELAADGFAVGVRLARTLDGFAGRLAKFPESAATFLGNGRGPAPGTILRQPDYARSLGEVIEDGRDAFYKGTIAKELCRAAPEHFRPHDFRRHSSEEPEPLRINYRGCTVCEQPLPSQGLVLLIALNILENFGLAAYGAASTRAMHLQIEAIKLAFEDRLRYAGDPRCVDVPVEMLLSKEHAAERAGLVSLDRARPSPVPHWDAPDTTSLVAADREGMMVTYIHSLFSSNACVAGRTGILMNNRMRGFELQAGHPNVLAPGKRPMHTLNTYVVLRDGQPWLLGGTPGAHFQVQTNLQILTNMLDFGMGLQEAIDFPRWTIGEQSRVPGDSAVNVEQRVAPSVMRELELLGHRVVPEGAWASKGTVQAVMRDGQVYRAGTDARRWGDTVAVW